MKTEVLKTLGLTEEQVSGVMAAYGKSVAGLQEKGRQAEAERDALKSSLAEANKQTEGFKGLDVDGIQKAADEWKAKYEKAEADRHSQIEALKLDAATQAYASGLRFTSDLARRAFVAEFKSAGMKLGEDGKFLGAEDFTKAMREKNPSAFEVERSGGAGFADKTSGTQDANTAGAMNTFLRGVSNG